MAKKGKKSNENLDRIEHLKASVKKHKYHEEALEQILRKLENETISKDQVSLFALVS